MKTERKPTPALMPTPVVLLSVAGEHDRPNIITLAWVGVACSSPPMLSVAIRPSRYSYRLVNVAREFVVNIPRADQLAKVDRAGVISGIEHDKFEELGFTAAASTYVAAPRIEECPVNIECVVRHQLSLGAHDLYIAEIVGTHYDEAVLDERGRVMVDAIAPLAYAESAYWTLGERVGRYGMTARTAGEG